MIIIYKYLHSSVNYRTCKVCHCLVFFHINKVRYYGRINHFCHIKLSLKWPPYIQTTFRKVHIYQYEVLSSEIPTHTNDCWKNINIWIKIHIICITTTGWNSYRITLFESFRLPNTALKHFINGKIKSHLFYCLELW